MGPANRVRRNPWLRPQPLRTCACRRCPSDPPMSRPSKNWTHCPHRNHSPNPESMLTRLRARHECQCLQSADEISSNPIGRCNLIKSNRQMQSHQIQSASRSFCGKYCWVRYWNPKEESAWISALTCPYRGGDGVDRCAAWRGSMCGMEGIDVRHGRGRITLSRGPAPSCCCRAATKTLQTKTLHAAQPPANAEVCARS
jgi:hypothetical protein